MRRLNLAERPAVRFSKRPVRARRELRLGGLRVFLDEGTLEAHAAEAKDLRAPVDAGLEPEFPAPLAVASPKALVLSLTRDCNLGCRYCYVKGRPRSTMTAEVVRRALELLRAPGPWRLGFFGGEPLLAWGLLEEAVGLARERATRAGVGLRFNLTTNGTLLSDKHARFLAENGFSLIVSLDGPRELHDAERKSFSGGSFEAALEGLQVASRAGLSGRITLRATFPLERPALRARLEFLNELADRGLAGGVSVEPAWPPRGRAAPLGHLAAEYLDAARWALKRLELGRPVRFHHLEKPLERILLLRPAGSECGAAFGYVGVAPEGQIYACHKEYGGPIGDVWNGISERARFPWRENRWWGRSCCARCWARNICGGGCRAESVQHEGDISRPWGPACAARRFQIRSALYLAAHGPQEVLRGMLFRRWRPSSCSGSPAA